MSCPNTEVLFRYVDDELGAPERRELERHLEGCQGCSRKVADERAFARRVSLLACPDPESLARFIDDALPPVALERVAAHVLECEPCREVVAWTREGQQQVRVATGRRRRRTLRRGPSTDAVPTWAPLVAAAALFFVLTLWVVSRPDPQRDVAGNDRPTPDAAPDTPDATPDTPDTPDATPDSPDSLDTPDTTPDAPDTTPAAPDATPAAPDATPAAPGTTPAAPDAGTETTPAGPKGETQAEPAPERDAGAVIALASAGLEWRAPTGEELPLRGTVRLPAEAEIFSLRGGGLQVGETSVMLAANASVRLGAVRLEGEAQRPGRITLVQGEALFESSDAGQELAMGDAVINPGAGGGRFLLAREANSFTLCVMNGGASVQVAGQAAVRLGAGEGRRLRRGALGPLGRDLSARLRQATLIAGKADALRTIDSPRGFLALRGLRSAASALAGDLAQVARGSLAVSAMQLDPRLANLPAHVSGLSGLAEAQLDILEQTEPAVLSEAGAASEAALTLLCREGRRPDAETRARLDRLTQAIAARPVEELAADSMALLALRAVSNAKLSKLPRGLFRDVAKAITASGPADLGRALLAGRKLDAQGQAALLSQIDALLAGDALGASELLEVQRTLILGGGLTPARARKLDEHALALAPSPELALLYARLPARLLGLKLSFPPASVSAVPAADGAFRVTFKVRPQTKVRGVLLCGSWDGWVEDANPMVRQPDGSFSLILSLPARTHQYKLRLTDGSWEVDAANPLTTDDERGGKNSVLPLD